MSTNEAAPPAAEQESIFASLQRRASKFGEDVSKGTQYTAYRTETLYIKEQINSVKVIK